MSLEHSPARQNKDAYTIKGFCEAHSISVSFYFKLKAQGLGPREMRLGTRVLITRESAAIWRRAGDRASVPSRRKDDTATAPASAPTA
jgi:hypothetical protein